MTTRMKRAVAAILAATLPLTSASADVGSSMDSFLNDVGGAANIIEERVHRTADIGRGAGKGEGGREDRGDGTFHPSSHVRLPSM